MPDSINGRKAHLHKLAQGVSDLSEEEERLVCIAATRMREERSALTAFRAAQKLTADAIEALYPEHREG